jgi:hypothetical protein
VSDRRRKCDGTLNHAANSKCPQVRPTWLSKLLVRSSDAFLGSNSVQVADIATFWGNRLMVGIFGVCRWDGLRCHEMRITFHTGWVQAFRNSQDTDSMAVTHLLLFFFQYKKARNLQGSSLNHRQILLPIRNKLMTGYSLDKRGFELTSR